MQTPAGKTHEAKCKRVTKNVPGEFSTKTQLETAARACPGANTSWKANTPTGSTPAPNDSERELKLLEVVPAKIGAQGVAPVKVRLAVEPAKALALIIEGKSR